MEVPNLEGGARVSEPLNHAHTMLRRKRGDCISQFIKQLSLPLQHLHVFEVNDII